MPQEKFTPLQRNALIMVLLNALTTPLMLSAVNVALPAIAKDLGTNAILLSWVPMSYLMASAMFVLLFGRLADMFGRKKLFLFGTAGMIITSLAAASASSGEWLVTFRFFQGVSAAVLYATQAAIITSVFPPARRGSAIGLMVSALYLGLTGGPLLGGFLIDQFGWQASFLFQLPLAFIVLYIGYFKVSGEWSGENNGHLDITGATVYALSIVALCTGVSNIPSSISSLMILFGLIGIGIFIKIERTVKYPIFDIHLFFSNRIFTLSCFTSFLMYAATFTNVVLISLYLQYLKEYSAGAAGLIMMIQPLAMSLSSPFAGRLSDHIEPRIVASCGMGLTTIALSILSQLNANSSDLLLSIALFISGLGFGLFSSPNTNAIMSAVDRSQLGTAAGSNATMRLLGQMTSMIMVTLLLTLFIGPVEIDVNNYPQLEKSIQVSFMLATLICVPGIFLSLTRGRMRPGKS